MKALWALLTNQVTLQIVGTVLLLGGGYFAWQHYVAEPYRQQGRVEMRPTIELLSKQLQSDQAAFNEIAASMQVIKAKSEEMKKAVALAEKANANRKNQEAARVEYIDRLVPVGNTECERVTDVIAKGLRK
jgi:cell pole-organizing protein PopZ